MARRSETYDAIHRYVQRTRGPAKNHKCIVCGNPAKHWGCLDNKNFTEHRRSWIIKFSNDPNDYAPLCPPCHRILDQPALPLTCKRGHWNQWENRKSGGRQCKECKKFWRKGLTSTNK